MKKSELRNIIKEELKRFISEDVAKTIIQQLGHKALYMLGAKNLVRGKDGGKEWISFRIGKNSKGINYIKIYYNAGKDLYDIEFGRIRGVEYKTVNKIDDIYFDQLHELIEKYTGMYVKL